MWTHFIPSPAVFAAISFSIPPCLFVIFPLTVFCVLVGQLVRSAVAACNSCPVCFSVAKVFFFYRNIFSLLRCGGCWLRVSVEFPADCEVTIPICIAISNRASFVVDMLMSATDNTWRSRLISSTSDTPLAGFSQPHVLLFGRYISYMPVMFFSRPQLNQQTVG